jgi:hypothetical protein
VHCGSGVSKMMRRFAAPALEYSLLIYAQIRPPWNGQKLWKAILYRNHTVTLKVSLK